MRSITPSFVVAPPTGAKVRTRLRLASWRVRPGPNPTVEQAIANGVVAVDLNADHPACWAIDRHGNPVGGPVTLSLALDGLPTATRDGHLRAAISATLDLTRAHGAQAVVIEDLGFAEIRSAGRETLGRGPAGKRRRRIITGIPTRRFRNRLVQMAHHQGLWVVAEDPAYTSKWGGRCWQTPLQRGHPLAIVTRHRDRARAQVAQDRSEPPISRQQTLMPQER